MFLMIKHGIILALLIGHDLKPMLRWWRKRLESFLTRSAERTTVPLNCEMKSSERCDGEALALFRVN